MENNVDIENLFKNTLENAEAQPPAGAWEAIQAKIGATAASTSAGAAATGLGIGKIAAIVVTALGVGLGAGYLAFKGNNETGNQNTTPSQENIINDQENVLTENAPVSLPEDVKITEVSSVNKADKTISIVEVKKGEETKKILVEIPNNTGNNNTSVVNQWLSPSKNDKLNKQAILQRIMEELEREDNNEVTDDVQPTKGNVVVQTIEKDEVVPGIITDISKENSLTVHFSNMTLASAYEWSFSDNTTSTEANPTHTFSAPGGYVISLVVYDKAGKAFTDKIYLEVKAKDELAQQETSSINKPNVFTPNGDGVSDEFYFTGKNIESFTVNVFDQNNKIVYTSNDINQRWNGNDKAGNPLPKGTYLYIYKAVGKDKKIHQDGSYFYLGR